MTAAELASACLVVAGGGLAALAAWPPQPKPEPPPAEQTCDPKAACVVVPVRPVVKAEPPAEKTDAERIADVERDARKIALEQRGLIDQVKSLTEEVKGKRK